MALSSYFFYYQIRNLQLELDELVTSGNTPVLCTVDKTESRSFCELPIVYYRVEERYLSGRFSVAEHRFSEVSCSKSVDTSAPEVRTLVARAT
ncbi:hypothetical protein KM043_009037 [Ampulex compressa]|nr:hypothetical protein KM043_009037 [Ampulex compressa]